MKPLPTTTVSGYLGSGKTTLVNRLLAAPHGLAITVLVNDFGEVALDDALIESRDGDAGTPGGSTGSPRGDIIALANGCMCCQIGGALYDTIDDILRMRAPPPAGEGRRIDHLVIETSGVADPLRIAEIAMAEPELEARHTLVLVDALNFPKLMQDARLADTLARQVEGATLVALTKTDLVAAQSVPDIVVMLEEMAPGTPILASAGEAPHETLLDVAMIERAPNVRAQTLRHAPGGLFFSWSWEGDEVPQGAIEAFLAADLAAWRIKGVLATPAGGLMVHRAGDQTEQEAAAPPHRSRLVAIGTVPAFSPARCEEVWAQALSLGL